MATSFFSGTIWWVLAAIVVIATVYEYDAQAGGLLILVVVFGMLLTAEQHGTISFTSG